MVIGVAVREGGFPMENLYALWKASVIVLGCGALAFLIITKKQKHNRKMRRNKELPLLASVLAGLCGACASAALYVLNLL